MIKNLFLIIILIFIIYIIFSNTGIVNEFTNTDTNTENDTNIENYRNTENDNNDDNPFNNIPIEVFNKISNETLPKIIHHICPNDFKRWHSEWLICYESWLRLYPEPEYEHMHWDDKELEEFIAEYYPWFLDIYKCYDVNIKRYDISRIFLLHHYGGIYADMDYMAYKNFFDELPIDKVSIPESPYKWNEHIQNSLMMGPPNNIFWLYVIDECYDRTTWNVFSSTGPQLLTPVYFKYPDLVNILPYELYNPNIYEPESYDNNKIYCKHLITTSWSHEDIR